MAVDEIKSFEINYFNIDFIELFTPGHDIMVAITYDDSTKDIAENKLSKFAAVPEENRWLFKVPLEGHKQVEDLQVEEKVHVLEFVSKCWQIAKQNHEFRKSRENLVDI